MKMRCLIIMLGMLFVAAMSGAQMCATLHHELSAMTDVDEDGIPDDLMTYLSNSGVTLPSPYDPNVEDQDEDGMSDLCEWILGTDPLSPEVQLSSAPQPAASTNGGMQILMALPSWFGSYAEVFARSNLVSGTWMAVDSWIPTYGEPQLLWDDVLRPEQNTFFYRISDGTWDFDGDGRSDFYESLISQTDPEVFNNVDTDLDGMHDWWEEKLFGDLSQNGSGDFDGDTIPNNQELVWLSSTAIVMISDPSLYDSDADELSDFQEKTWQTDPMKADTDDDGLEDGLEVSERTDPLNPDTETPVVSLSILN